MSVFLTDSKSEDRFRTDVFRSVQLQPDMTTFLTLNYYARCVVAALRVLCMRFTAESNREIYIVVVRRHACVCV